MTKINDNKLNMVTGGNFGQTAFDSQALHFKGYMDEEFSEWDMIFHWVKNSAKVDAGWARAGIRCVTVPFAGRNQYYKDGKSISEKDALHYIGL